MIELEDIIECKSYQGLCDFLYDAPNLDHIPPSGVVHVPLDQIEEFFKRIDGNGHQYIVVSSCSDFGLAYQEEHPVWKDMMKWLRMQTGAQPEYYGVPAQPPRCDFNKSHIKHKYSVKCHSYTRATFSHIPDNVHHWFISNLMINDDTKMTAIPFGIAEGKKDLVHGMIMGATDRDKDVYISWQDYTYDRYALRKELEGTDFTIHPPNKPQSYINYLMSLKQHRCVVSPPGNGEDCYRTLEALYMGAAVMVENTVSNRLLNLPVTLYDGYDAIIEYSTLDSLDTLSNCGLHKHDRVKLSYWKAQIAEKREEIL